MSSKILNVYILKTVPVYLLYLQIAKDKNDDDAKTQPVLQKLCLLSKETTVTNYNTSYTVFPLSEFYRFFTKSILLTKYNLLQLVWGQIVDWLYRTYVMGVL